MRFHHVALATGSIKEAYTALSANACVKSLTGEVFDLEQQVRLQLLDVGGVPTELVEDTGDGPAAGWLKRGCKLYHICYEVDDLDKALKDARGRGCVIASPAKPAILFGGRRVAFVVDGVMGLVEFLEKETMRGRD